jgi:hypothetical protein
MFSYCTACQRTFDTVAAYRKHRTGRFVPNTRRCRTETEMLRSHLSEREGAWHLVTPLELLQEEFLTEKAQPFQVRAGS